MVKWLIWGVPGVYSTAWKLAIQIFLLQKNHFCSSPSSCLDRSTAYMPGPTLLFIGPFDQLPREAELDVAGRQAGQGSEEEEGSSGQKSKTQEREREREGEEEAERLLDFKIDVLTFRPELRFSFKPSSVSSPSSKSSHAPTVDGELKWAADCDKIVMRKVFLIQPSFHQIRCWVGECVPHLS